MITDAANRAAVAKAGKDYGLVSAPPIELSKRDSRFSSANYAAAGLFRSMFSGVKPADVNDIVAAQKDLVDQMFSTLFKRSIPFDVQLRFIRASIQYEPAADPGDDAAFFKQTMLPRLLKLTQNVLSAATEAMMRAVGAAA